MATGIPAMDVADILKKMTQEERLKALLRVLERVYWQRLEKKGKESRSHMEKKRARELAAKKERARKAGLL